MSTNYYYHLSPKNVCNYCNRSDKSEIVHIGKSSAGWTFSFHGTDKVRSYKDWIAFFETNSGDIVNEYGKMVSINEFKKIIESKMDAKYNHAIYSSKREPEYAQKYCWIDNDGHSFNSAGFL